VTKGFVRFFEGFWCHDSDADSGHSSQLLLHQDLDNQDLEAGLVNGMPTSTTDYSIPYSVHLSAHTDYAGDAPNLPHHFSLYPQETRTLFLLSQHHRNPSFRPFPWQSPPLPPPTPLNSFLLHIFANAATSIVLQTPNLTAPPVLTALLAALARGVSISITTNERLMFLEQLVTAGTTTPACIGTLISGHQNLKHEAHESQSLYQRTNGTPPGSLRVAYFSAKPGSGENEDLFPISSHLKMTVVDEELLVLGSGNMDRASWFTSQEVGVAFESREMVKVMLEDVRRINRRCSRVVYDD